MVKLRSRFGFLVVVVVTALPCLLWLNLAHGRSFELSGVEILPTLEHRTADGGLYTPSTQSLLRTHSWLEKVEKLHMTLDAKRDSAEIELVAPGAEHRFSIHNLPARQLVPRLHYRPAGDGDAMDALNLMLAEYSRNGLSVPFGHRGDSMAHFRTDLEERVPWRLAGDYQFVPNPEYRPQRFAVINNCLAPGLWELSATDRSGEIYHAWLTMPDDFYFGLVATVNGLDKDFVARALTWKEQEVALELDRLRRPLEELGEVPIGLADETVSFSSQGSRRKLHRDYALYRDPDGELRPPAKLSDLQRHPVAMTSFVEPGLYSSRVEDRTTFDFTFLSRPRSASMRRVEPLTDFAFDRRSKPPREQRSYLEMTLHFENGEQIVLGNLPLDLLVRQQDFAIHGFGVGILAAGEPAERRAFLIDQGPRPSYAYLARAEGGRLIGLNSHGRGLEQIFIRSLPDAAEPHFTITLTSYERIVDIVKLRVDMPEALVEEQKRHSDRYIPPIYFTYRDDNVN